MKPFTVFLFLILLISCRFEKKEEAQTNIFKQGNNLSTIDLNEIQDGGEIIMATLSGPDTYYDYNGMPFGLQYELCENFAQTIGVRLRIEIAKDENDLIEKLINGNVDLIATEIPISKSLKAKLLYCGCYSDSAEIKTKSWATRINTPELAKALSSWYKPGMKERQRHIDTQRRIAWEQKKFSKAPQFKLRNGQISPYDALFKRYSGRIGWDWRLMAAQAYQESAYNPNAVSWAGACGVMQIMPSTAKQLGIAQEELFNPSTNIYGAALYISKLNKIFASVNNPIQRQKFVLAAYNGGSNHIKDAMALAQKYGKNSNIWDGNVEEYVLLLSNPRFYNDPIVKHGYMRGNETYNYVRKIYSRWTALRRKR